MARTKTLSDPEIFAHLMAGLAADGEKAVSFGEVSRRSGLAPATLAQRYGSVQGMLRAALLAEWATLTEAVVAAEADALVSSKGAQALLKALPLPSPQILSLSLRDEVLQEAAKTWRDLVEQALAARRGGGSKGRESAALIFAAWQGRHLWDMAGGKAFRISDLLKAMP